MISSTTRAAAFAFLVLCVSLAQGQFVPFVASAPPGVYLDTDGKVQSRQVDQTRELADMRARTRAAKASEKDRKIAYISLPHLFAQLQALQAAKKPAPDELRFLSGLTQIEYVFVYPDEKDLVIAGPAEPWRIIHEADDAVEYAYGTKTGRPILQLDDLIAAFRTARLGQGRLFGCGIYPSPDSLKIADQIEHDMARNTREERMTALANQLGPQEVRIFGTQNDTRFAYMCVAADYELKRFALGMDRSPVAGVGNGVDHSRSAANKYWFEASYDPIRISLQRDAYKIGGQRLLVRAGAFDFDPRGATEKAVNFAAQFTKHLPELAAAEPLFAELQNIADESLVANLIRRDGLAEKVGWNNAWVLDESACAIAKVPVPRMAQTLVNYTNGSVVAGGVMLTMDSWVGDSARHLDNDPALVAQRNAYQPNAATK